jgi:DNA-binding transcriptional MocR family regulator
VEDFRPLGLVNTFGKLGSKVIVKRFQRVWEESGVAHTEHQEDFIQSAQHGFRAHRGTDTALSQLVNAIEQAERYQKRRIKLITALSKAGFTIEHSKAGLYIWCSKNEDCYKTVDWFANLGGLVTPGSFYGSEKFIRIALTATDESIDLVVERNK